MTKLKPIVSVKSIIIILMNLKTFYSKFRYNCFCTESNQNCTNSEYKLINYLMYKWK